MVASIEERLSKVEGVVSEHDRIFDMIHGEIRDVKVSLDNRIDDFREEINRRFDEAREQTNRRFDEAREETNRRFDEIDKRMDKLDGRIDKVDGRIDETNKKLDSNFKWLVAIQVTTLIAIIGMGVSITLAMLPK
jgi:vacuolar-type H+-ATPase subunit H